MTPRYLLLARIAQREHHLILIRQVLQWQLAIGHQIQYHAQSPYVYFLIYLYLQQQQQNIRSRNDEIMMKCDHKP